jgi:hypothetical protein
MKTLLQKPYCEEIEIQLPFYAYIQDNLEETFVKIDEKEFKKITFSPGSGLEFYKYKFLGSISDLWYTNQCTEKRWLENLENAKNYVNEF